MYEVNLLELATLHNSQVGQVRFLMSRFLIILSYASYYAKIFFGVSNFFLFTKLSSIWYLKLWKAKIDSQNTENHFQSQFVDFFSNIPG